MQFDQIGNDVLTGETGNLVRIFWDRQLVSNGPTSRGPYGYYQVRSNGVDPQQGLITEGNVHSNNIGLFVQDAWTINNKLTVNLGLRTENEHVPNFADASYGLPATAISFSFGDKLAPRAGFAYDLKGDGKWKVYGSWGIFYDIIKLELPRGSFGGDKWLEYYYTLDTPDWPNLDTATCPPACPGTLIPRTDRLPSSLARSRHPGPEPQAVQAAGSRVRRRSRAEPGALGGRPLRPQAARPRRRGHRRPRRAAERDLRDRQPERRALVTAFVLANGTKIAMPKPKRDYDAVELSLNKRMANHWSGRVSATCGAGCTATTPASRSRTRTAA